MGRAAAAGSGYTERSSAERLNYSRMDLHSCDVLISPATDITMDTVSLHAQPLFIYYIKINFHM